MDQGAKNEWKRAQKGGKKYKYAFYLVIFTFYLCVDHLGEKNECGPRAKTNRRIQFSSLPGNPALKTRQFCPFNL